MATVAGEFVGGAPLAGSPYADYAEKIAPGITSIVESQRTTTADWWDTLEMILPSMDMTDEQRVLLGDLLIVVRGDVRIATSNGDNESIPPPIAGINQSQYAGLNSSPYAYTPEEIKAAFAAAAPTENKPDLVRIIAYVGAAITIASWL